MKHSVWVLLWGGMLGMPSHHGTAKAQAWPSLAQAWPKPGPGPPAQLARFWDPQKRKKYKFSKSKFILPKMLAKSGLVEKNIPGQFGVILGNVSHSPGKNKKYDVCLIFLLWSTLFGFCFWGHAWYAISSWHCRHCAVIRWHARHVRNLQSPK